MENLLAKIVEAALTAGPFAVLLMLWLYIRADGERREVTRQMVEMTKQMQSMSDAWLRILGKRNGES